MNSSFRSMWVCASLGSLLAGCAAAPGRSVVTCKSVRAGEAAYEFKAAEGTSIAAAQPGAGELLISPRIGTRVAVTSLDMQRTPTGLLRVNVQLANCTSSDLVLRMRTQFVNAVGANSEAVSIWRDVPIGPGSVADYQESAFHEQARSARVELDLH